MRLLQGLGVAAFPFALTVVVAFGPPFAPSLPFFTCCMFCFAFSRFLFTRLTAWLGSVAVVGRLRLEMRRRQRVVPTVLVTAILVAVVAFGHNRHNLFLAPFFE